MTFTLQFWMKVRMTTQLGMGAERILQKRQRICFSPCSADIQEGGAFGETKLSARIQLPSSGMKYCFKCKQFSNTSFTVSFYPKSNLSSSELNGFSSKWLILPAGWKILCCEIWETFITSSIYVFHHHTSPHLLLK